MAAAKRGCCRSKSREEHDRELVGDRNHASTIAARNDAAERDAARARQTADRPPDPAPAPAGRAKTSGGRRAARPAHRGRSYFSEPKERIRRAGERNRSRSRFRPSRSCNPRPSPETTNWCCREICRPSRSPPFLPAPTATSCAGTRTLEARFRKGNCWRRSTRRKIDQELSQARASREQVRSALGLAKISADRWANLRKTDSVSEQEADQQASGYQQAQANLASGGCECSPPGRTRIFQESVRSFFRRAYPAQCRSGRAH